MKVDLAREIAWKAMYQIEKESAYSNIALDGLLTQYQDRLSPKDVGFISEIVYGSLTWKLSLDAVIAKYSHVKLKKIAASVLNLLRIGSYQILFLDRVPKSAAVNETVNLCKKYNAKSVGLVNAILRKIQKEDYLEFANLVDFKERMQKQYSFPLWMIEEFQKQYTQEQIEKICQASNQTPDMSIRINCLKTEKAVLKEKLEDRKIEVENGFLEDFLVVKKARNIGNLDLFQEGYFTVQDQAAGLSVVILDPKPGETILDACSAPGGKTTYLAEKMGDHGSVIAWDLHEHRVGLVKDGQKRLGIKSIQANKKDATQKDESLVEKFDRVLLDVPCMGLGVIRRKPDIKWKHQKEDLEQIKKLQMQILENGAAYLKKGGYLVYSTCSILAEENQKQIEKFLANHQNQFKIIPLEERKKEQMESNENILFSNGQMQLLPSKKQDGFFIALLQKR